MLLVQVAILTLLHPQSVTVNGTKIIRLGHQIEVAGQQQQHYKTSGKLQIKIDPDFERTYDGALEIAAKGGELQLILTVGIEDLVAAIVPAESPPGAPPSAQNAQAILARSWIAASGRRHREFDFCDTTHCQHFKQPDPAGRRAAQQTKGLVLAWQDKPFAPAYSASCGGRTKSAAAIGWNDEDKYPYFAVDCRICQKHEPAWTRTFDDSAMQEIQHSPNQEKIRLAIGRRSGWDALPSNNYAIDGHTITGRGRGHGLGYCQRGGAGMALQGATAAEILRHYFPGTNIMSSR